MLFRVIWEQTFVLPHKTKCRTDCNFYVGSKGWAEMPFISILHFYSKFAVMASLGKYIVECHQKFPQKTLSM